MLSIYIQIIKYSSALFTRPLFYSVRMWLAHCSAFWIELFLLFENAYIVQGKLSAPGSAQLIQVVLHILLSFCKLGRICSNSFEFWISELKFECWVWSNSNFWTKFDQIRPLIWSNSTKFDHFKPIFGQIPKVL